MSLLVHSSLVLVQAFCNQIACTPPNQTPSKSRYHTEEATILQLAPLMFKIHTTLLWLSAVYEVLSAFNHFSGLSSSSQLSYLGSTFCPVHRTQNVLTPMFILGIVLVVVGMFIRVRCFRDLGHLFTFDLTIHPEHKLVTSGFYRYVRHPSYTGSLCLIAGITFSHLTPGSWVRKCGVLGPVRSELLWAAWWIWSMSVCVSRANAEDKQLRKLFTSEWDIYAARVRFWFVPGLL